MTDSTALFKANLTWLVQCYGHCLPKNLPPKTQVTCLEFARLIGEAYDLENGINQFAATFAAKLPGHFEVTRCLTTYTQN